ncbi:S41 family peptidase [Flavobacterium sp. LS1R49]|uniref:S41 family peptidase n=1 Tax=Flavobacterium shii TaxID=2987687 RepID=A0A9X3BXB4_9FLAO|nr:S41 family peptidase [Flavobacterium shii]MCV9926216.1 S41 family peptidase [Flavobacterium shii]
MNWLNKTLLLLLLFSITICSAQSIKNSANDTPKVIEFALLKQDFIIFRNQLQKPYPSLYRFNSKKNVDKLFDNYFSSIDKNTTQIEFLAEIKLLLSYLQDGHFYGGAEEDLKQYFDEKAKVFPLKIRFIKDNAYVVCSKKESLLPETQILSINNVPIKEIKEKIFQYIVSDGKIETKKYWILNNNFWFYYRLVYGEQPTFKIEYKSENKKIKTINLDAELHKNTECETPKSDPEKYLQLDYKKEGIALLTIKTFNGEIFDQTKENYIQFLEQSFKEIKNKKIDKLIIDVRGNGGGRDTYGSLLYSYLTNAPFEYYTSLESASQKLTKDNLNSYIPPENSSEDNFRGRNNLITQKPSENNYAGKVYILIDGMSFSTTAEFCAIAKSNDRATFIGEETGGGYFGNTSGNAVELVLPNTKIYISIPTTQYVLAVKKDRYSNRGIFPDYEATPTINDYIQKKDVPLDLAIKLADESNKK